jgi:poly-gamma-glutamate synthesis protein (capsule biosynthesis protein)
MLGRNVNDRWVDRDPAGVWGSARDRLQALSGVVANLECCISGRGRPRSEKRFNFRASPSFATAALTDVDVAVVALANNHVLDFGERALEDTLTHLDDAGVAHAGAGGDHESAFEPAVATVDDLTVATISLTDQYSPYAASDDDPGTAFATLDSTDAATRSVVGDAIEGARGAGADLVVASLHWGRNYETEPSDTYRAFAHWLVDSGVDVVHGHSAHILQAVEVYQGRPILYDVGDFVDDYVDKPGYANKRSGIFELVVDDGAFDALRVVPTEIEAYRADLAGDEAAAGVRETLRERSKPFGTTIERDGDGLSIPLS